MSETSTSHLAPHLNFEQESQSNPDEHYPDSSTLDSLAHLCPDEYLSNPFSTTPSYSNPHSATATHDSPTQYSNFISNWSFNSDSYAYSDSDSINCFLTDLFENRSSQQLDDFSDASSYINPFSEVGFEAHDASSGLRFGGVEPCQRNSSVDGLRATGFDSDSDSASGGAGEFDRGVEFNDWGNENGGFGVSDMGLCLDNLENQRTVHDNLEWEGLEEREDISVVIDEVEDLSVASGFSYVDDETGEEEWRYLEWQILLAINNLGRNTNLDGDTFDSAVDVQDAFVSAFDYEATFEVDSEVSFKMNPPASKVAVENLPLVELKMEDMQNISTCAICKDEVLVEEKLTRLPCSHYYHGECIIPWLSIHNTCPLCRSELPTDDPDYERRKIQRSIRNLSGNWSFSIGTV